MCGPPEILVEGDAEEVRGGASDGHRHAENGVGAELGLVLGPVEVDHRTIDVHLLEGVEAADLRGDSRVDILDGLENAFAEVALLVAVAKLDGLVIAGAGPGGYGGPAQSAVLEDDVDFDGGIAAGIENLARLDVFDNAHNSLLAYRDGE